MTRSVLIFTIFCLSIYCNVVFASSGTVPPAGLKKPSTKAEAKTQAPKSQPVETTTVTKKVSQKKANVSSVTITQKKVSTAVSAKTVDKELLRKRRIIKQKRAALNNSKWNIEVLPLKGGEKTKDIAIFKDNKIGIESLLNKGFSYTNYTLTIKNNGTLVWETMQTKGSEVVFMRGEVASDITRMHGIISFPKGGSSDDYSFKSVSKQIIRR